MYVVGWESDAFKFPRGEGLRRVDIAAAAAAVVFVAAAAVVVGSLILLPLWAPMLSPPVGKSKVRTSESNPTCGDKKRGSSVAAPEQRLYVGA